MEVIFYSTHCPRCKVIETKLKQKNISYTEINDLEKMIEMGFKTAPLLSVDGGDPMEFSEALKWLREQEVGA